MPSDWHGLPKSTHSISLRTLFFKPGDKFIFVNSHEKKSVPGVKSANDTSARIRKSELDTNVVLTQSAQEGGRMKFAGSLAWLQPQVSEPARLRNKFSPLGAQELYCSLWLAVFLQPANLARRCHES
jgi:hypothetical protein